MDDAYWAIAHIWAKYSSHTRGISLREWIVIEDIFDFAKT
jgi:hypothetical protein